jgi:hypothetical protein
MATQTKTRQNVEIKTWTQSIIHVSNEVMHVWLEIANLRKLSNEYIVNLRETLTRGLFVWLTGRYLETAFMEVYLPSNTTQAEERWGMNFIYLDPTDGNIEGDSTNSKSFQKAADHLLKEIADQLAILPDGAVYRIVFTLKDGAPAVEGWSSTQLRDVSHLQHRDIGRTIDSKKIGVDMFIEGSFA